MSMLANGAACVAADHLAESGTVVLGRPLRAERFVGAICEHDQRRFTVRHFTGQNRLVPIQKHSSLCAVDAQSFVGDAGLVLRHPSQQPHRGVLHRSHRVFMTARRGRKAVDTGRQWAVGIDCVHCHAVHREFEGPPSGCCK